MTKKTICFIGPTHGFGGPISFQRVFTEGVKREGYKVIHNEFEKVCNLILLVMGTRKLKILLEAKRRGIPIVQRLDGINWRHRVIRDNLKFWIISEWRNFLMKIIRDYFSDFVIYQSKFVKNWWHKKYGVTSVPYKIIYNAVNLDEYPRIRSGVEDGVMIIVEGTINSDPPTYLLLTEVHKELFRRNYIKVTKVFGKISTHLEEELKKITGLKIMRTRPHYIVREELMKGSIFLSLEINPSCPNSVIEALASGVPVVGFKTGGLPEIVVEGAGELVGYQGNPWKLEPPRNIEDIIHASIKIFKNLNSYKVNARRVAETKFNSKRMAREYIEVFSLFT